MKREEVLESNTWRLSDLFDSTQEWDKEFSALNKANVEIVKYKGRLADKEEFAKCMELLVKLSSRIEKLYCYAAMLRDQNCAATEGVTLCSRAENIMVECNTYTSFIEAELAGLDNSALDEYIASPELADYKYFLSELKRNKAHILSEKEERLLSAGGTTFSGYSNIFNMINNVDLPLPKVCIDGVKQKLTHGKYSVMMSDKSQITRKRGFEGMYKAVQSLINVTGATYAASVSKDNFLANVRNYKSALAKSMDADNVPAGIYGKLIDVVGKNLSVAHEYVALRKKVLGLEKLHMYDLYTPLEPEADISCDYETAFSMALEGLKPMGEEYISLLKSAKESRWIDVYETQNKRSGAYSMGVYGAHPYVLLNYSATPHDIFTIAHELGHAMHSFYSDRAQSYMNADYSIFVAEVASTVNEVLLLKDLIAKAKDKSKKAYLLSYYLDMFRTTLFRQTMFAEFELIEHENAQNGKALTVESLSKDYYKLNKKYYGKAVEHDRAIRFEWARIPHFYSAFYVYKYATGITSAVNIAHDILSEGDAAVSRYKQKFLTQGGVKSPYEILCDVGVDLNTEKPYDVVMKEFGDTLAELKTLVDNK